MKLVLGKILEKIVPALAITATCAACAHVAGDGSAVAPAGPTDPRRAAAASQTTVPTSGGPPSGQATRGGTVAIDPGRPLSPVRCAVPGLRLSTVSPAGGGGMGHQGLVLVFTNTSGTSCVLDGYPGVTARDDNNRDAADARRETIGYIFPSTSRAQVVLPPNGTASAGLEWTVVPSGNQTSCPTYVGLTVTPPGETRSLKIVHGMNFCGDFEIHPLVAGATAGS